QAARRDRGSAAAHAARGGRQRIREYVPRAHRLRGRRAGAAGGEVARRKRPRGARKIDAREAGDGRGERIRTSGLYVPNVALYQAKLHPEAEKQRGDERAPFSIPPLELSLDGKVRQL